MTMAKAVGVLATFAATGTIGPAITPPVGSTFNPVLLDLWGVLVPAMPIVVGVLSSLLVRIVIITSSPHKVRLYNVAVTMIAMLGSGTFIADHHYGMGPSFWIGCGFGALGVGIIEIAKSRINAALGISEAAVREAEKPTE